MSKTAGDYRIQIMDCGIFGTKKARSGGRNLSLVLPSYLRRDWRSVETLGVSVHGNYRVIVSSDATSVNTESHNA